MDEHEVNVSCNQAVFQPCQSFQFWLIVDGQLIVFAQRRHFVVFQVSQTGLAEPESLLSIYLHLDILNRDIPDADLDDVTIRGRRRLTVSSLIKICRIFVFHKILQDLIKSYEILKDLTVSYMISLYLTRSHKIL